MTWPQVLQHTNEVQKTDISVLFRKLRWSLIYDVNIWYVISRSIEQVELASAQNAKKIKLLYIS